MSNINTVTEESTKTLTPEEFMGATQILWAQRNPMTITGVLNAGRTVVGYRDKVIEIEDEDSGENVLAYVPDYDTPRLLFTLRRGGMWVAADSPTNGAKRTMELGHPPLPVEPPKKKK